MANETKRVYGTQTTLEASGATCTNTSVVQADDASLDMSTAGDYPHASFALTVTFSIAPSDNATIELIAQALDIDGAADEPAPTNGSTGYTPRVIDVFVARGVSTSQTLGLDGYDLPRKAAYWLRDSAGQTIASGWVLKATPFTFAPT